MDENNSDPAKDDNPEFPEESGESPKDQGNYLYTRIAYLISGLLLLGGGIWFFITLKNTPGRELFWKTIRENSEYALYFALLIVGIFIMVVGKVFLPRRHKDKHHEEKAFSESYLKKVLIVFIGIILLLTFLIFPMLSV